MLILKITCLAQRVSILLGLLGCSLLNLGHWALEKLLESTRDMITADGGLLILAKLLGKFKGFYGVLLHGKSTAVVHTLHYPLDRILVSVLLGTGIAHIQVYFRN